MLASETKKETLTSFQFQERLFVSSSCSMTGQSRFTHILNPDGFATDIAPSTMFVFWILGQPLRITFFRKPCVLKFTFSGHVILRNSTLLWNVTGNSRNFSREECMHAPLHVILCILHTGNTRMKHRTKTNKNNNHILTTVIINFKLPPKNSRTFKDRWLF